MTARMLAALAVPAVLALAPSSSTGQATVTLPANPQQTPVVTAADYARAEGFLRENTMPLVSGLGVQPTWLAGDRFGYRITTRGQSQFILVNPSKGTRIACSPETDRCGCISPARNPIAMRSAPLFASITAAKAKCGPCTAPPATCRNPS